MYMYHSSLSVFMTKKTPSGSSDPSIVASKACSRVFLRTARQYHSLCMLGLGFVASLAIILVIQNYGKFKISVAIPK